MTGHDTMQHDAQRKAFVTLQARAALIGAELYPCLLYTSRCV